jgi:restriction system protein
MPFPKQKDVELPLLQVLVDAGGSAKPRDLYGSLAKVFGLTDEEKLEKLETGPVKWWNLVQWVRQKLVETGEIDGSVRGVWKVTDSGRLRLKNTNLTGAKTRAAADEFSVKSASSDFTLRDLVNASREEMKSRLLTEIRALTPAEFERFCAALLQQLGFEQLTVTGKTADGGVDGFGSFRQGAVSLKSAFQAKQWKGNPVGRPEIDKFRGAIQGEFDHGVFLTTNRFTRDAEQASVRRGAITILLLDAHAIANHMMDRGIGIRRQPIYLLDLDESFFQFDE